MTGVVTLACGDCGGLWVVSKRSARGAFGFPDACQPCRDNAPAKPVEDLRLYFARRLCRQARAYGIDAQIVPDPARGWVVMATTPFHEEPVRLWDGSDARYLAAEIDHAEAA